MPLREEFVRDFVFPMMRANARYEGDYLLGTSIARPLISKRLVEIARETDADAIAHGATGTEWEIWRVGNPYGTCTRQMGALDRLDKGQGRRQGPVRRGAPAARSTLRPDLA